MPRVAVPVVGLLLAAFFLAAFVYKLSHAAEFWVAAHKLWPMHLLTPVLRNATTGAIVGLEGLVGVGLMLPRWRGAAAALAAVLIAVFTLLVAPQYNGCECTWQLEWLVPHSVLGFVLRNLLLAALAVGVARAARRA
jgi:hypothetical protein